MASKKAVEPPKRVSSFSQALQAKNQGLSGKAGFHGKNVAKLQRKYRAPPSLGNIHGKKLENSLEIWSRQVVYTKEAEERFHAILEGNFSDVPPLPRSTVRIFLSSTFSDMRAERNMLAREAYPKLRDYCTEQGLSFQVVDLRWGITAEATNSHVTTKICLLELKNCQKISLGPCCITMIGNRYGFCPLPSDIPPDEFDLLSKEAASLGLEGASILTTWYLKDDNAVPPVYSLQPITNQLPNFLNESRSAKEKKEADVKAWSQIEHQLLDAIHKAAISCADKGTVSREQAHFYIMSVTEHEARNGVLPGKHALAFLRELQGLEGEHLRDSMASRHKDVISLNGQLQTNKEIGNQLTSLKQYLSSTLTTDNVNEYKVQWEAGGLNPNSVESHQQYISKFCSDFISGVKCLINKDIRMNSSLIRQREFYSPYAETLHHAHFCELKCQSFCGQTETLQKIKSYVLDSSNRKPFVIYAHSGAGKTSIMAMAMKNLKSWLPGSFTSVIRFLGTSPNSTNIYSVLFSICGQLADVTDTIMEPQGYKTMKTLQRYLPRLLRTACSALKTPVVIFLDSLDQLEPDNDAYAVKWLPQALPSNLKIIISTLPKEHGILNNLRTVISDSGNFFEVPMLSDDTSHEIIKSYFALKKRCITGDQMKLLQTTFKKAASPLYLKLLMDQAISWRSHDSVSSLNMPESVKSAINKQFEQLEVKFGAKIVQAALGLITVGLNGLSEIELEDAISCIDEALIEIYKYHDPPVPGMIRVPPVLWARIRYDINEYLVERQSQGVATLFWYHRQFIEAAFERYVHGDKGQHLHRTLFEMYASEDGIKRDITLTQRKNLKIENADRYTTPQLTTLKNVRKLECMSYHFKNSYHIVDKNFALSASYCNLKFLHAKIVSKGADRFLTEIQEILKMAQFKELKTILKFVSICKNSLSDITVLAFKILAYIDTTSADENLIYLKKQAKDHLMSQLKMMLVPSFACLSKRSGEPEKIYDNLSHMFIQRNELCLFTDDWIKDLGQGDLDLENTKTLTCLDLKALDVMKFACENINSKPYLSSDGKMILYLSESELMLVKVFVNNGVVTKMPLSDVYSSSIKPLANHISRGNCCISGSHDCKFLALSIHDRISVVGSSDLKPVFQLTSKDVLDISNLHICQNLTLAIVGKCHKDSFPQSDNIIQVYTKSHEIIQKLSITTDIAIQTGASDITYDDTYLVCFGKNEKESKNLIILCNLKTFLVQDQIDVKEEILAMKISPSDAQGFFLEGGSKLMLMNFFSAQFVNTLKHDKVITAWAVNWEEETLLICDEEGDIALFSMEMEKLMTHHWMHSPISISTYSQDNVLLLTDKKAKIWNMEEFFLNEKSDDHENNKDMQHLKMEEDILSFVISENGQDIVTAGNSKECKVWSSDTFSLLYKFDINIRASVLCMAIDNKIAAFDKDAKQVVIFDYREKKIVCNDLPENIMCLTLTKNRSTLILASDEAKPVIYTYDLKSNSSSKKCSVNINFKCLAAEVSLTPSERYAVFMMKITEKDYQTIVKLWKSGNFPHQNHPYRFVAVDLSQSSGAALYACHSLSKIPHLGVTMEPYKGNQMMISTCRRRIIMYWDIPTGKCDQSFGKAMRRTTLYQQDWAAQQCTGDKDVISLAENKKFVVVGSQDGDVFVYEADSGMAVEMQAPSSKHHSPVNLIAITRSSQLVASACTSGVLKLWHPHTGECLFSASIGMEMQQLCFTPHGTKVIALTNAEKSRTIIFDVANFSS